MRVMVFGMFTAGETSEPPTVEAFAAMDRFTDALAEAGVLVASAGLKPMDQSRRLLVDVDGATVVDGPLDQAGDVIAGFSIWEVKDMDEAVAWAKRSPASGPGKIEIRPFFEVADLAEFVTPEELAAPRDGERGRLGVA